MCGQIWEPLMPAFQDFARLSHPSFLPKIFIKLLLSASTLFVLGCSNIHTFNHQTAEQKWPSQLNMVKMSILSKLIYRSNVIPIRFPGKHFVDIDRLILKSIL